MGRLAVNRLPVRLLRALEEEAAQQGITAAELVRAAVARDLGLAVEAPMPPGDNGAAPT